MQLDLPSPDMLCIGCNRLTRTHFVQSSDNRPFHLLLPFPFAHSVIFPLFCLLPVSSISLLPPSPPLSFSSSLSSYLAQCACPIPVVSDPFCPPSVHHTPQFIHILNLPSYSISLPLPFFTSFHLTISLPSLSSYFPLPFASPSGLLHSACSVRLAFPLPSQPFTVLGVEYCTGYADENSIWRQGFYCPKNRDSSHSMDKSKDIFCCGTQTSKYCCDRKEGFTVAHSGFYVSFSTLISVTFVTFTFAVVLTALAFVCCKRYWKVRERSSMCPSVEEATFYRMACSSSTVPLVPFSPSFNSTTGASLTSPMSTSNTMGSLVNPFNQTAYPVSLDPNLTTNTTSNSNNGTSIGHRPLPSRHSFNPLSVVHLTRSLTGNDVISSALALLHNSTTPSYPPPPYQSTNDVTLDDGTTSTSTLDTNSNQNTSHHPVHSLSNNNNNNILPGLSEGHHHAPPSTISSSEDSGIEPNPISHQNTRHLKAPWRKLSQ